MSGCPPAPDRRRLRPARAFAWGALFASLFIVPFLLFGSRLEQFSRAFFDGGHESWAVVLVGGGLLASDPVLPVPSSIVATLLAARVGFTVGAVTNAIALSVGCLLGYYLGRAGGWAWQRSGRTIPEGFERWVSRYGVSAVVLCRPVPILAEASLMIAGATAVRVRPLLAWCVVTQVALGTAYAFAGSGWGDDRWNGWAVFTGAVLVPAIGGAVVLALVMSGRRQPPPPRSSPPSLGAPETGEAG